MKIVKHPLFILFFILSGVICGIFFEEKHAQMIGKLGNLYIELIKVTVIPILISAIISSVARLIHEKAIEKMLKKIILTFTGSLILAVSVTMAVGFIVNPGVLTLTEQIGINKIIKDADTDIDLETMIRNPEIPEQVNPFFSFFMQLISPNIFRSLSEGHVLEIVFFCFVLGSALGKITTHNSKLILSFVSEVFYSIQTIISWILYLLPFGLFAIVVQQVSSMGVETLASVVKFLLSFMYIVVIIVTINMIVIWKRSQMLFRDVLTAMFDVIILPVTTRNSFACIPVVIEALAEKLYFDRLTSNLLVPLGVTIARIGNIVYFCLAGIFVAQIYGVEFNLQELILLPLASIIAGVATAGASGFVTLQALAIVATPLGLPIEAIMVILYLIDPIIDPFRTLLIVNTNCAVVTVIADVYPPRAKEAKIEQKEEELDVTKAVMMQMKDNSTGE